MSRFIQTVSKWLPSELTESDDKFEKCRDLQKNCFNIQQRMRSFLIVIKGFNKGHYNFADNELKTHELEDLMISMEVIVSSFNSALQELVGERSLAIMRAKINLWRDMLCVVKLKVCYFLQEVIKEIAYLFIYYGENLLRITLKLSSSYNTLLAMDAKYKIRKDMSVCSNTCPFLLYPIRKMSVTRLLQILANNRAELCCHKLIDCLLETYKSSSSDNDEDTNSDDSSIEIYRALTKHMSPLKDQIKSAQTTDPQTTHFLNVDQLISHEEKNVLELLQVVLSSSPVMLGDGVKKLPDGTSKISLRARKKVLAYYEDILWGEVGNYLEHVVLWWGASPLSARPPHSSQHLREWITQFLPTVEVPPVVSSALSSLADALGVHVTLTSWDHNFRLALVARSSSDPEAGKLFGEVLQDLVGLVNQFEVTPDWSMGAPLEELPLVEQIPALHRLDHSIHTTRLWAVNETKKIANVWNVEAFFGIIHCDVVKCLEQLNNLRLSDHSVEIEKGGLDVHVEVCVLMRAKLVSEVKVNIDKLKDTPKECVAGLSSVCRTISLANLQMIFPPPSYWRPATTPGELPKTATPYVNKYLNQILTPILKATQDHLICNMILQIMCEAWLDHIYMNKIKFSHRGALQLLCDFAHVKIWLYDCSILEERTRKKMLKNEVLRRCEGVGRLLLRCPGEQIKMLEASGEKHKPRKSESPDSDKRQSMPAEMYVPNQEQWLELRAAKKGSLFGGCCGKM